MHVILAILYFLSIVVFMFTIGIPYIIYKGGIQRQKTEITNICRIVFRDLIFRLFRIKVIVEGSKNIPKKTGFVIIMNHQSFMDTNLVWHSVANSAFMAKASLWKIPVFGWILNTIGCIPVYKNPRKNAGMGNLVQRRLDSGYNISVFPEGHRSDDGRMFGFQNGIFRIAKEHHFDILPITLIGVGDRLPKSGLAFYPGEVKLVIHPLVKAEDYADKPMAELRDEMHDLIESALPYKQAEKAAATAAAEVSAPIETQAKEFKEA